MAVDEKPGPVSCETIVKGSCFVSPTTTCLFEMLPYSFFSILMGLSYLILNQITRFSRIGKLLAAGRSPNEHQDGDNGKTY